MNNNYFKPLAALHLVAIWCLTLASVLVKDNTVLGVIDLCLCTSLLLQIALHEWKPALFGPKK